MNVKCDSDALNASLTIMPFLEAESFLIKTRQLEKTTDYFNDTKMPKRSGQARSNNEIFCSNMSLSRGNA